MGQVLYYKTPQDLHVSYSDVIIRADEEDSLNAGIFDGRIPLLVTKQVNCKQDKDEQVKMLAIGNKGFIHRFSIMECPLRHQDRKCKHLVESTDRAPCPQSKQGSIKNNGGVQRFYYLYDKHY